MNITLFFAIGVPLIIASYIVKSDKFPEPNHLIIKTFIMGVLLIIPAGFLNNIFIWSSATPDKLTFLAGFTEETLKFLTFYLFIKSRTDFDEPMDGVVYGVLISLGFATLENIEYVFYSAADPLFISILRAFTAIPLHAMCGVIMGFYFGRYAFTNNKSFLYLSLILPISIHAFYNFLTDISFFILLLYLILIFVFTKNLFLKLKQEQKNKPFEKENRLI
jgi:RsiW-degrading membrane proteinase PrsW (M82 family)